jgi:hypothetical protein
VDKLYDMLSNMRNKGSEMAKITLIQVIHCGYPYTVYEDSQWISDTDVSDAGRPQDGADAAARGKDQLLHDAGKNTEKCQL